MEYEYIQIFTTTDNKENAEKIAGRVVEERLVACAQIIGPIFSTYWWKGKIEKAEEWLCILKTKKSLYEKLKKTLEELHPYQTPEIIVLPIVSGSKNYLDWMEKELMRG